MAWLDSQEITPQSGSVYDKQVQNKMYSKKTEDNEQ